MKIFFDTEFHEGFKKPISWLPTIGRFNKPYHTIELISIGMINERGKTYYAISKEFDVEWSWNNTWLRENVLLKIYDEHCAIVKIDSPFTLRNFKLAVDRAGSTNNEISESIRLFCGEEWDLDAIEPYAFFPDKPEFYAYYADYDWVVFCSLFGTMMDLPNGFPMYCRDLKQMLDEKVANSPLIGEYEINLKRILTHKDVLNIYKRLSSYPKQDNEHNALSDAKWNFELYKYIKEKC